MTFAFCGLKQEQMKQYGVPSSVQRTFKGVPISHPCHNNAAPETSWEIYLARGPRELGTLGGPLNSLVILGNSSATKHLF